jgi:hypothetical protein
MLPLPSDPFASIGSLPVHTEVRSATVPAKKKGRDLLTLLLRYGRTLHGTLSDTPCVGVPRCAVHGIEFARFEKDSSRSSRNDFGFGLLVTRDLFFPPIEGECSPLVGFGQDNCAGVFGMRGVVVDALCG